MYANIEHNTFTTPIASNKRQITHKYKYLAESTLTQRDASASLSLLKYLKILIFVALYIELRFHFFDSIYMFKSFYLLDMYGGTQTARKAMYKIILFC